MKPRNDVSNQKLKEAKNGFSLEPVDRIQPF